MRLLNRIYFIFIFFLLSSVTFVKCGDAIIEERNDDSISTSSDENLNSFGLSEAELFGDKTMEDDGWNNLICTKDGPCKCVTGSKWNRIDCSHVKLKSGRRLDTANLQLSQEEFVAADVDLSHNEIEILRRNHIIPDQAKNIQALDLSFNHIADIQSGAFDNFEKLVKLKLTHNRLFDEEIQLSWLTEKLGKTLHQLYLDYNYITDLDEGIFDKLVNLNKLVLDGNEGIQLTSKTFGSALSNLKTISLDNCKLSTINDDVFKGLPNLQQLSLAGNPITKVIPALQNVPKLSILSLSETLLNEVPKLAFKENPNLIAVYMRKMKNLISVKSCAFCHLENLQIIDFSGSTKLTSIDKNAFGGISDKETLSTEFTELYVNDCNLEELSEEMLHWPNIRRLGLTGNKWKCDCSMYWLISNKKLHVFDKGENETECESPSVMKGLRLSKARRNLTCNEYLSENINKENETKSNSFSMLLIGFCATLFVVGGLVLIQKYELLKRPGNRNLITTSTTTTGYNHLERDGSIVIGSNMDDFNDNDESRLEDDFNRPEFV